jgi:hypothetical protein
MWIYVLRKVLGPNNPSYTHNTSQWNITMCMIFCGFVQTIACYFESSSKIYSEMKTSFIANREKVGRISPAYGTTSWNCQLTKLRSASWSAAKSLWTTSLVYGWKYSVILALLADVADLAVCCVNRTILEFVESVHCRPVCRLARVVCVFSEVNEMEHAA